MKKKIVLTCLDHTVSGEKFDLLLDNDLDMLITSPQPSADELNKYYDSEEYISHTDSKKSLLDRVYQIVKNYTVKQKVKLINNLNPENKTILDIGCGTGDFLKACQLNGWKINGIEPNDKARELAIQKTKNIDRINNKIEDLLKDKISCFDVITLWHVLEHIPNLKEYIAFIKKMLKPNGVLIVAVPNYKSYDAKYYGKFWAAYDVPRHLWHFTQKSMNLLFAEFDFRIMNTLPMKFDAYYVSLLSEKYRSGKSNPFKAFLNGFVSNAKAIQSKEYSSLIYVIKNAN
jgi:2-polyprenyl-3-methyl-5-hydroxy-6-metoxy-1,4-benzoquinol methylase